MTKIEQKILIVEDDIGLQKQLRWCFDGYSVFCAADRAGALAYVRTEKPQVITLDLGLPPDEDGAREGLAALQEILSIAPLTKVIMLTGNQQRENALKAIALGAYDFYEKPVDSQVLKIIVHRAQHLYLLEQESLVWRQQAQTPLPGVIAVSPQMQALCRQIEKVAPVDVTTVLFGESGTGKELLARAIHRLSPRAEQRFVAINCAAIPENLLESELFGYEKGAFTGAVKRTIGKFEYANGGTLMLDEIGDLPMALQAKLLRFLQERCIERLGGREEIALDVRIIAASHQDIAALVKEGRFREDLYYRLNEITLRVPPLRERQGDAAAIATVLLVRYQQEMGKATMRLSADALQALAEYAWPGNIRELENRLKRAIVMAQGKQLTAKDLELLQVQAERELPTLKAVRDEAEENAVKQALQLSQDNISQAAKLLQISRPTLYDLMQKYGLK